MKTISGYILDNETNLPLTGNPVVSALNPYYHNTQSDATGRFSLEVPNEETEIKVYSNFLLSGNEADTFTIPTPIPAVWNIRLSRRNVGISASRTNPEKKMWPYYALGGLALLLIIRKMRKGKKR